MMRRPPRSTRVRSSAASDVYKRQYLLRGGDDHLRGALIHLHDARNPYGPTIIPLVRRGGELAAVLSPDEHREPPRLRVLPPHIQECRRPTVPTGPVRTHHWALHRHTLPHVPGGLAPGHNSGIRSRCSRFRAAGRSRSSGISPAVRPTVRREAPDTHSLSTRLRLCRVDLLLIL